MRSDSARLKSYPGVGAMLGEGPSTQRAHLGVWSPHRSSPSRFRRQKSKLCALLLLLSRQMLAHPCEAVAKVRPAVGATHPEQMPPCAPPSFTTSQPLHRRHLSPTCGPPNMLETGIHPSAVLFVCGERAPLELRTSLPGRLGHGRMYNGRACRRLFVTRMHSLLRLASVGIPRHA